MRPPPWLRGDVLAALARRLRERGTPAAAAAFRATVRAALTAHPRVPAAAAALEVSRRTLEGWLAADPTLRAGIALPGAGNPAWTTDD